MKTRWSLVLHIAAGAFASSAQADEGMWPFNHLPRAELKRKYGFEPSDSWLAHLRRSSLRVGGGCSGSFVSSSGLTLTNHHCAQECLSRLSTPQHDYTQKLFYAKTAAEERVCPGYEILQLSEISDVTARLQKATHGLAGEAFHTAMRAESARIEKECAQAVGIKCDVVSLYHGGLYELYQYLRYEDVRLVFAPEAEIAFFGGDPDNFNFPRYDLDLTFLRAYEQGRPVQTSDYLSFAHVGLKANDITFVSGNPGSTSRLLTIAQFEYLRDHQLFEALLGLARYRGFLTEYGKRDPEAKRVSSSELFWVENVFKAIRGEQQALSDKAFFEGLRARERDLRSRVAADPVLKSKYGGAWAAIEKAQARQAELAKEYSWIEGSDSRPSRVISPFLVWARQLARAAEERPKKNEDRLEEYADAQLPSLEQRLFAQGPIKIQFEIAKLAYDLGVLREDLGVDHPFVEKVLGKSSPLELATALIKGSSLQSVAGRKRLFAGGKAAIAASKDRMIQLALAIEPDARAIRARVEEEIEPVITKNAELIAHARFDVYGMNSYPDATGSPRLSFGTVRGWRENGKLNSAFTKLGGAFERATGRDPFALPRTWTEKEERLDKETPFNFVTDNDITGGNSGSPVVNREGEFVGLVFDGNIHSLGGAFGFDMAQNRMVAVDARAIVQALDKVYGADRIALELTGSAELAAPSTKP